MSAPREAPTSAPRNGMPSDAAKAAPSPRPARPAMAAGDVARQHAGEDRAAAPEIVARERDSGGERREGERGDGEEGGRGRARAEEGDEHREADDHVGGRRRPEDDAQRLAASARRARVAQADHGHEEEHRAAEQEGARGWYWVTCEPTRSRATTTAASRSPATSSATKGH